VCPSCSYTTAKSLYVCMFSVGSLVSVCGLMTFTSHRSMEIEVVVEYESLLDTLTLSTESTSTAAGGQHKAVDAFFTFVAIDSNGKATPVPSLVVHIITVVSAVSPSVCLCVWTLSIKHLSVVPLTKSIQCLDTITGTTWREQHLARDSAISEQPCSVCLSVCLSVQCQHISWPHVVQTLPDILCVCVADCCGSVLFWYVFLLSEWHHVPPVGPVAVWQQFHCNVCTWSNTPAVWYRLCPILVTVDSKSRWVVGARGVGG